MKNWYARYFRVWVQWLATQTLKTALVGHLAVGAAVPCSEEA